MKILIGGGSGLIGRALTQALQDRGDEVTLISRTRATGQLTWQQIREEGLPPCDAVINLAGANVMTQRWSDNYKELLHKSRVETNQLLVKAMERSPPKVWIHTTGIGYYPSDGQPHGEGGAPGTGFLSRLAVATEASAKAEVRSVGMRIGIVLTPEGGALKAMLPLFRLGLGGRVGSGQQGMSWIHIDDLVQLFLYALDHPVSGPMNGCAPHPVSQAEFAKALGRQLGRPTLLPFPAWAARALLGERAELLLAGPYGVPEAAVRAGFQFQFPELEEALADLLQ